MINIKGKFTEADIFTDQVESECLKQIYHTINHPSFTKKIKIMPDCHSGRGSVIGFTMPLTDSVIPNIIGVDLGCGVSFCEIPKESLKGVNLLHLDKKIREDIPFGPNIHKNDKYYKNNYIELFNEAVKIARKFTNNFNKLYHTSYESPEIDEKYFNERCKIIGEDIFRVKFGLGTVGGGNHYCEISKSFNEDKFWISIHCGSRHFGLSIATFHQKIANDHIRGKKNIEYQQEIIRIRNKYKGKEINKKIREFKENNGLGGNIPKGMEYLTGREMFDYLMDMVLAQTYAKINRKIILSIISNILDIKKIEVNESVHNYINFDDFVIRKGAISSYTGQTMIIPINMKFGSLICLGKSNPDWNFSAPHGAGRIMSRSAAKNTISMSVFREQMKDIVSTSVGKSTLDEAPDAYKKPEFIMESIEPTATIVDRIIPLLNMKDTSEEKD